MMAIRRALRGTWVWGWLLVLAIGSLGGCDEESYGGLLKIERSQHISAEESRVEAEFANYLENDTKCAITMYRRVFGKIINTDSGRELSSIYAPGGINARDPETLAARTQWSAAVHEPASALMAELYGQMLEEPSLGKKLPLVIFLAGGAGAGKTSTINQIAELKDEYEAAQIIYDTTLSHEESSLNRIDMALGAGKMVHIVYIYRDPVDAFMKGVLPRAKEEGRVVPLEAFIETHLGALNVIEQIANDYDGKVQITYIDNSRGPNNASPAKPEFLQGKASMYTRASLRQSLSKSLQEARQKDKSGQPGGISKAIFDAFMGRGG